jgi:hypothetical protein
LNCCERTQLAAIATNVKSMKCPSCGATCAARIGGII